MPCFHPIPARQDKTWKKEPDGSWRPAPGDVILNPPLGTENLEVPCGKCLGCFMRRAAEWAHRCEHEASLWEDNCFLTLTYKPEALPDGGNLAPQHLTDFFKRLRRARDRRSPGLDSTPGHGMRYLTAGEYGSQFGRPHYHILLFNCGFSDQTQVTASLGESQILKRLWPHGGNRLGTLTGASANYVAQYTIGKVNFDRYGETQTHQYHDADGVIKRQPFLRVSNRPAIGKDWVKKFKSDLAQGYLVQNGHKRRIPRYYKKLVRELDGQLADQLEQRAAQAARNGPPDRERTKQQQLHAEEAILRAKVQLDQLRYIE